MQIWTVCKAGNTAEAIMDELLLFTPLKNNAFGKIRGLTESIMEEWTENIPKEVPTFQDRIAVYR